MDIHHDCRPEELPHQLNYQHLNRPKNGVKGAIYRATKKTVLSPLSVCLSKQLASTRHEKLIAIQLHHCALL